MAKNVPVRIRRSDLAAWSSTRQPYLDNLKVVLIVAIIAIHGVIGYAGTVEVWSYSELREVTLSPVSEAVLIVIVAPFGLFMITLLFLVAGLLSVRSLDRKGPRAFARDRLVRLGIPYLAVVLLVQPATIYALEHPLGLAPGSYWEEFLGSERQLDSGVLWFVAVLLVFSLVYAGWVAATGPDRAARAKAPIRAWHLAAVAGAVGAASFLVRLVYPYGGESGFLDLNYWEWPACIAVFALGIAGARRGWASSVPEGLRRVSALAALVSIVAMAVLLLSVGLTGLVDEALGGGHWAALAFAVVEAPLVVFGSVWLLSVAQRSLDRRFRWGPIMTRSAYGAFIVQTVILIAIALALRPIALPAEAKAILVAAGGVAGSFALAWLLISRVPGMARVL